MRAWLNDWVLTPAILPSWLQAAAAVVALFISAWAVWRTGDFERRRDRLERRGIAVAVYPEMEMLKEATKQVRERVAQVLRQDHQLVGQSVAATLQYAAAIQMPPMLERNTDRLYILGDTAGPSCLQLFSFILQYNGTAEALMSRITMMNAEQWRSAVGQLDEHLTLLDQIIDKCERELRVISDSVKG